MPIEDMVEDMIENVIKPMIEPMIEPVKLIEISKPNEPIIKVEKQLNTINTTPIKYENKNQCDNFETLFSRVPMSSDIKPKKTKKEKEKEKEKELELEANNIKKSIPIEELLKTVSGGNGGNDNVNSTTKSSTNVKNDTNSNDEELKPLAKYNLVDLQFMARLYKIDTQKMGNCNKKINKLKGELYEEIKNKM